MKKTHSRFVLAVLVALLVAATCISVFSVSVSAETKNGITAMLSTDKVSYAESDPVKVTLNVTNQSGKQAVVTTTVTAPEGWIGVSGQAVNTMTLESGDTNTGELVLQAKKMGGTGPLVLILIIVLVIILALLVVFLVVKKKKRTLGYQCISVRDPGWGAGAFYGACTGSRGCRYPDGQQDRYRERDRRRSPHRPHRAHRAHPAH